MNPQPTVEEVRDRLHYDPETGVFRWAKPWSSKLYPGDLAGSLTPAGYVRIGIGHRQYAAHRLAWLYIHGEWPAKQIDHINGDRTDNRIANLRLASPAENGFNRGHNKNNTIGLKGVTWHPLAKQWRARIWRAGKQHHIGFFRSPEEAHAAYRTAAAKLHGEFAWPGNAHVASRSMTPLSRRHQHALAR